MTTKRVVTDEILGRLARKQHDLFRRVRQGSADAERVLEGLQLLIEGHAVQKDAFIGLMDEVNGDTVTVPDLPAAELIALVESSFKEAGIPLTCFNPDFVGWDFLLNERGKTFRVFVRNFGRDWMTDEGRAWQRSVGADGNVAAFVAWVIQEKPRRRYVSIPDDDARLFRYSDGDLCAPNFDRGDGRCGFNLEVVRGWWRGRRSLVAFREVSKAT